MLFDRPSFKNCICLELVLDAEGKKMSKSRGNVVDPIKVIQTHGADALRWYCYTSAPPGMVRRFDTKMVQEITRQFMLTLWNVYSFFIMYANIDEFTPGKVNVRLEPTELDRWIISELNQLVLDVDTALDNYDPTSAGRKIEAFVDELSNWYVRRNRRRFWKSGSDVDKLTAYNTLYECLVTLAKLMAPFMPFLAEELYRNLVCSASTDAPESVHLTDFPKADESKIDKQLAADTQLVIKMVSLGRAARNKAAVKVRQPLEHLMVCVAGKREQESLTRLKSQILEELNVKDLKFGTYEEICQLATKGYVVGGLEPVETGEVQKAASIVYLAALPTTVSPELAAEGMAREIVHRLQTLRREANFEITDTIIIYYQGDEYIKQVMTNFADYVKQETLARELIDGSPVTDASSDKYKLDGHDLVLGVKR